MTRSNILRVAAGATMLGLLVLAIGATGEQLARQPLEAILADIPAAWYEGGWDKRAELLQLIAEHPTDALLCARAQFYVASQYYAERDHQRAIQEYQKLIREYPSAWLECQKAQFEIGQIYLYRLDNPDQALREYQRVIQDYPRGFMAARAQLMIGRAYRRLGDVALALEAYRKVSLDYPQYRHEVTEARIDEANLLMDHALADARIAASQQALSALKQAYLNCLAEDTALMEQIFEGVARAFRALDGSMARANAFIAYQRYGADGADGVSGSQDDLADPLKDF